MDTDWTIDFSEYFFTPVTCITVVSRATSLVVMKLFQLILTHL